MRKRGTLIVILLIMLTITTACSGLGVPAVAPVLNETALPASIPVETAEPLCAGDKVNPIGEAIADKYESVSYDQVMTWYCTGAEFEDILVALETELQTETAAHEMLQMLVDGFTWEDVWLITGLTD